MSIQQKNFKFSIKFNNDNDKQFNKTIKDNRSYNLEKEAYAHYKNNKIIEGGTNNKLEESITK